MVDIGSMKRKRYYEGTQTDLSFLQNRLCDLANVFDTTSTQDIVKMLKEPVGPWAKSSDKDSKEGVFTFLQLGKKLRTSDLDKLYWVKFLQKKFPNLGKKGNKDDIEKELLKEFGEETTMSPPKSKEVHGSSLGGETKDPESKVLSRSALESQGVV